MSSSVKFKGLLMGVISGVFGGIVVSISQLIANHFFKDNISYQLMIIIGVSLLMLGIIIYVVNMNFKKNDGLIIYFLISIYLILSILFTLCLLNQSSELISHLTLLNKFYIGSLFIIIILLIIAVNKINYLKNKINQLMNESKIKNQSSRRRI